MTTIITKYGNGVPTSGDLETGELGIDLTGKVIYTKDGGNQIIKLADGGAGATVDWADILNKPDFDSLYAEIDHTHEMADVDGLEDGSRRSKATSQTCRMILRLWRHRLRLVARLRL